MKEKLQGYWREHDLGASLNLSMACLALIGVIIAIFSTELMQGVGVDLAFLGLGVLLTVYFVDAAVKRREERRWSTVDVLAHQYLRRAATEFLISVSREFDKEYREEFTSTGFEMRVDPENAHLKMARSEEWNSYIREEILPLGSSIRFETLNGQHDQLIQHLASYHTRLSQLWPLMNTRWSPGQITEVLGLIFAIPRESQLLDVHRRPGVNVRPASLKAVFEHSLRLIELCNSEDDPHKYVLPYDPEFDELNRAQQGINESGSGDGAPVPGR